MLIAKMSFVVYGKPAPKSTAGCPKDVEEKLRGFQPTPTGVGPAPSGVLPYEMPQPSRITILGANWYAMPNRGPMAYGYTVVNWQLHLPVPYPSYIVAPIRPPAVGFGMDGANILLR